MDAETTCCIVGGGPAGMMLGYLLARQGVSVTVLEKHKDFFRDFRGDTVHPSTLGVLDELGLLEDFLKIPHQKVESAGGVFGDFEFRGPDFTRVPSKCKFVALMPQWDFLNFLSERAREFPSFRLLMEHEATDLLRDGERVSGVRVSDPHGDLSDLPAHLVVGCDGRHSATRRAGGMELLEFGVPMDVLWFRISRKPDDPKEVLGRVNYGRALILIDRADYFQAGLIIPKGSFEHMKKHGLDTFREIIVRIAPFLAGREDEIESWDKVKILTVQLNRLKQWHRDGLLCIGDAAHAMSPVGGVGINLAIQDAVAAANLLTRPLQNRRVTDATLASVQRRRELATRVTQAGQALAHRGLHKVFESEGPAVAPWQFRKIVEIPGIHHALGYAVGIGVRPEHVEEPRERKPAPLGAIVGFAVGLLATFVLFKRTARAFV